MILAQSKPLAASPFFNGLAWSRHKSSRLPVARRDLKPKPSRDNTILRPCLRLKMFYIIGLGLSDEKDVTVRGLEVVHTYST